MGQIWPAGRLRRLGRTVSFSWRRLWRKPVGTPLPVWPAALTMVVVAGAIAVALLFPIDAMAIDFMLGHRNALTAWLAWLSDVGLSQWYLVPALAIYLAAATADWQNAGYRLKARLTLLFGQAAFMFAAVAISGIAVNLVKIAFGRARPSMFGELGAYHFSPLVVSKYFSSFPSGHATTLGAAAAVLAIWFPRHWLPITVAGLGFAMLRVVARAHYPSDVAAGFLFGWVVVALMARMLAARRMGFRPREGKILPEAIGMRRSRPDRG
ncbi:phosphatase PAP2 family protein [Aminobacter sp. Piv2-1]|uniref:phosphatase PAP2 family protein n=1 Tax=Aminobacter sp. Piv2-1 TaxID=3031122 RepID=UPI0030A8EABD